MNLMEPKEPMTWEQIRHWRKQKREELLVRRAALCVEARHELAERARAQLLQVVDLNAYKVLGFCWAIKGEIDVRRIAEQHLASGGEVAIPVIVQKAAPVEFWRWRPGIPMQIGIWNINRRLHNSILRSNRIQFNIFWNIRSEDRDRYAGEFAFPGRRTRFVHRFAR